MVFSLRIFMVNKRKKNIAAKVLFDQKFLSLIGLTAIILISLPFAKNAVKQSRINKEISNFKKEIAALQDKSTNLKNFVSYLESDQFIEDQARLNLNLKKSGEELTVIKTPASGSGYASSSSGRLIFDIPGYNREAREQELSNPRKWLNYFF